MKRIEVFFLSLTMSLVFLALERVVGIGWDFHPDAVTYATTSRDVFEAVTEDWFQLPNNAYYVISYFLGQNVVIVTCFNIIVFSLTNAILFSLIKACPDYIVSDMLILLILCNPYRLHLSTTMLKDTVIIFFVVLLFAESPRVKFFAFLNVFLLRVASPIYLLAIIPKRYLKFLFFIGMLLLALFWDATLSRILEFNDQDMQLRDFDRIPTFQEFGFVGGLLRGVVWSLLAFSGIFALISPALAFFPVAAGSVMTLIFLKKVTGEFRVPMQILLAMMLFGVMVTGFTAYIRYVYPLLIVWPLVALKTND